MRSNIIGTTGFFHITWSYYLPSLWQLSWDVSTQQLYFDCHCESIFIDEATAVIVQYVLWAHLNRVIDSDQGKLQIWAEELFPINFIIQMKRWLGIVNEE